ncbi:chemotaxis protein CheW [Spirochaeta lutea]|uniref:Chemotaxis protein CheW n=1 Tax=Spirochaeta lutea TaxID=1480694 RepID=A0A098R278_9SPIO|nr:chemotaxis protein CheW [Spirochaeta lutea]KGE73846.1 chemotaxis protein CheW [Spirochaeta lutea]
MADNIVQKNQYLTFELGRETYAIEVMRVREVLELNDLTRIPKMPEYMRGVINLRGSVVPVLDLRLKFGLEQAEKTLDTRIVVLEVGVNGEEVVLGALADKVNEVIEIPENQIDPAPRIGTRLKNEVLQGVGKRDEQFIIILDIDKIFSADEIDSIIERQEG